MIEALVAGLIYLCLLVLAVVVVKWVVSALGVGIPDEVMKIIWIIVALVAILIIVRTVLPHLGLRLGALPSVERVAVLAYSINV